MIKVLLTTFGVIGMTLAPIYLSLTIFLLTRPRAPVHFASTARGAALAPWRL